MNFRIRSFCIALMFVALGSLLLFSQPVQAATCSVTTDTVITQAWVDTGLGAGACTDIEINGSVSTTWLGTVDLNGSGVGTVTVKTGSTMSMGSGGAMVLGATDNFVVETNATTTHAASSVDGLQITAANITVSGALDADSKGCTGVNPAGGNGYGPHTGTGVCTLSTSGYGLGGGGGGAGGNGGAHGGAGSVSGAAPGGPSATYGSSLAPTLLGSGGGTGYYMTAYGGAGGGRIQLMVSGTLTVSGSISANGGTGIYTGSYTGGGGGSGGSVYIITNALAGAGTIRANGGGGSVGGGNGGNGGGGRLAILYNTQGDFVLSNITASKGTGGNGTAVNGTTYVLNRTVDDGAGTLTINSGFDFPASGDYTRDVVSIGSGADLSCIASSATTISSASWVSFSGVTWTCSAAVTNLSISSTAGISTTSTTFTLSGVSGGFSLTAPVWTNTATTFTLANGASSTWDIASDLTLNGLTYTGGSAGTAAAGGVLSIKNAIALSLVGSNINSSVSSTQLTALTVDGSSSINATGKGCAGSAITSDGYGPNVTTGVCAISTSGYGKAGNGGGGGGGGAAHAGTGAAGSGGGAAQATTYGSNTRPVLVGSGGGGGYWQAPAAGGNGGGMVNLVVTGLATIDGPIRANGSPGLYGGSYSGGGGGSGGSIYLDAGSLAGSGSLSATGGNGATGGGGGGGGRIAVVYGPDSSSIIASMSVAGGAAGSGAGTVGTTYALAFSAPDTSSIVSPAAASYNATLNPILTSAAYSNSPGNLTHLSSDWKVTSDSGGSTLVWSATGDTINTVSTQVNTTNGTFTGALAGQTALAASSTYYAFVRHTNSVGTAAWSSAISFTTLYVGVSSTFVLDFDDPTPATAFEYDPDFIEINASGNGLARLRDLGGGSYGGAGLAGYSTYKQLSILNNVAETFTNAQVSTTVAYASGMQSDFDDIRFTADDGLTLLDHYRLSKTDGVSALFHIEVPTLPASDTTIIRMYYGNADVASASSFLSTGKKSYASDTGLRAEWLMDEGTGSTIADTSGNGNSGTYTYNGSGGWLGSDSQFSTGDATKYDGSGDGITTPVSITGLTDDFSLETWAHSDSDGSGWGWFFGESAGGTFLLGKTSGASSIHYNMDGLGSGNTAAGTFTAGSWHHVVFSHDKGASNATKIYVDGSLVATLNAPSWSPTTAGNFLLGQRSNGETFTGKLDSGRVYTRALSAAEVLAHYQNRHYFSTDPTVTFGTAQSALMFASSTISVVAGGSHPSVLSVYRMEETLAAGSTGAVTYQLSMDGSTWNYWNGSAWATASDDAAYTNTSSTMNAYLPLFVNQVGSGDLYVRTLFTSNGTQPVGLDALTFYYTPTNVAPDAPTLLGQPSLVDGSTTSTVTPTFSFTLTDSDVTDTVKYQIQIDDSADFGSPVIDYTSDLAAQGERSFQVGQAAGSGSYVPGQDATTLSNGSYYWQVKAIDENAAASSYETANAGSIAFEIDATSRYLSFEGVTGSGLESVTATSVRILLSAPHFENVSTTYSIIIASTTAEGAGTDYVLSTGEVMIPAGETSTTISLVIVDDDIDEPNETIGIELSSPVNALIGSNTSTLYTIIDDDTAGVTFSETTAIVTEGLATDTFQVVLTSAPTSTVQILFATTLNGVTLSTSTIDFTSSNWNVPVEVTVTATDDTVSEGTHLGTITPTVLTTAYGYSGLSPAVINATITDNDSAGVSLSKTSALVTEGRATDSYTIVLTTAPTSTVEVLLTASNARLSLSASVLTFTTSDWSTPQTVTVSTVDDTLFQSDQTGTITHVASSTGIGYLPGLSISSVTVSIGDTDNPGGGASSAGGSGGGGGSVQTVFSLVPSPAPIVVKPDVIPPSVVIIVAPAQEAATPPPSAPAVLPGQQVVTILNPTDIKSLVQATNGSRDFASEARSARLLTQDAREFRVPLSDEQNLVLANFVTYGISERTRNLGSGERRALVRDALQTMKTGTFSPSDLERLARGMKPEYRNLSAEMAQLPRVRQTFQTIYGRLPNFKDPSEDLAWNALMYRIRFPRDLKEEAQGIQEFKKLFKKIPTDPFQWATVRVLGYVR